ncbi:hypothetical protein QBC40DRAFT_329322 [Triangularia verruculosa]|uniref:RING-type domain-containing protein n=1 Tax=Triangularia verruculosa TaxID=2587418 RepID=A0AAN6XQ01_9PEZI|nr:hypothetical protein QBC40DRAFT_329322 [Triangularia verruculosa]
MLDDTPPIPPAVAAEMSKTSEQTEDVTCPICLEDLLSSETPKFTTNCCKKPFHTECISRWSGFKRAKATCPLCRRDGFRTDNNSPSQQGNSEVRSDGSHHLSSDDHTLLRRRERDAELERYIQERRNRSPNRHRPSPSLPSENRSQQNTRAYGGGRPLFTDGTHPAAEILPPGPLGPRSPSQQVTRCPQCMEEKRAPLAARAPSNSPGSPNGQGSQQESSGGENDRNEDGERHASPNRRINHIRRSLPGLSCARHIEQAISRLAERGRQLLEEERRRNREGNREEMSEARRNEEVARQLYEQAGRVQGSWKALTESLQRLEQARARREAAGGRG